ncbi:MAG: DegT/DnrJ/EryC1/StrS family aminotransferase [Lachnospiraceae bacterium]|nr:DegT/DnrJ/EryC1/StrS family aminotransferase [Lachnospiraceae bacterium]
MIPLVKTNIADRNQLMPVLEQVIYSGYVAAGEASRKFEEELREYIGNPYVLALNSGTAALHIALLILDVGPGDEIISTPMTAEPTNTTIAVTGAKVVWADVDPETGLASPASIREKITNKTKAIMLVHYAGMVCDMDEINKISEEFNIPVIEDAAHAFGSKYNGKIVGSNSRFTCYSFQAIKQLTTIDGGAIAFTNPDDMAEAKKLRWFGLDRGVSRLENDIKRAGYKYEMNNVNATIGSVQLKNYPDILKRYIDNGMYFDRELAGVKGVTLIPYYKNTEPSYWLYTMKVERRNDFIKMMEENGIMASPLHHRTDTHSVFAESKCDLPGMEEFYSSFVHIPCGWWVDDETRAQIVKAIRKGW